MNSQHRKVFEKNNEGHTELFSEEKILWAKHRLVNNEENADPSTEFVAVTCEYIPGRFWVHCMATSFVRNNWAKAIYDWLVSSIRTKTN